MTIVLPFFDGDRDLALKTLQVIQVIQAARDHNLLIHTPCGQFSEIADVANKTFKTVWVNKYVDLRLPCSWPAGANHAWMQCAQAMRTRGEPWFWLEPDAVPLVPEAFDLIERASPKAPIAGAVMTDMGGHINGVARYTPNILDLMPRLSWDKYHPFDRAMHGIGLPAGCLNLSRLILNRPRAFNVPCRCPDPRILAKLIKKGYAVLHGATDGSVQDHYLAKVVPKPVGYFVPIDETCLHAEFDDAEAYFHFDANRLFPKGWRFTTNAKTKQEYPSFTEQTGFPSGYFDIKRSMLKVDYNPSIVREKTGKLTLLTREWKRPMVSTGIWDSTIQRFDVDEATMAVKPAGELNTRRTVKAIQNEDPRVVYDPNRGCFYVMHVSWRKGRQYMAHQRLSIFNSAWAPTTHHDIKFGGNGSDLHSGTSHEKNWLPFFHQGVPHIVYSWNPHLVFSTNGIRATKEYETKAAPFLWKYGEIRGGTPPVLVGDRYYSFFHSSLWWKQTQKRYYMGAYSFRAEPPFAISSVTEEPILVGSHKDRRSCGGPLVIFPGGADFKNDIWTVVFGVNDEACGWIKIPHIDLMERMTNC